MITFEEQAKELLEMAEAIRNNWKQMYEEGRDYWCKETGKSPEEYDIYLLEQAQMRVAAKQKNKKKKK